MTKREYLYHFNRRFIKLVRKGAIRLVVKYAENGNAWDLHDDYKKREEIRRQFNIANTSLNI